MLGQVKCGVLPAKHRGPKDHINIRILQSMICGFPLILGLGTRMSDPYVYVVFWAPETRFHKVGIPVLVVLAIEGPVNGG